MGKLIGTRFDLSGCEGTQGSLEFIVTSQYSRDLTTMHLDYVVIQIATMSRKRNPRY